VSWRVWTAFAALGVIWGVPYFFIKLAVAEISPLLVAFVRVGLAAAILVPIAWRRGALPKFHAHGGALVAFALVEFVGPMTGISLGEQWISSSVTGILIATVPMWVVLLSRSFGVHEQLGVRRAAGFGLGFIGVVVLMGFGTISGLRGWVGVGCIIVSALGYAIGPLIILRHLSNLDSIGPLAAALAIATAVLFVPALFVLPTHAPSMTAIVSIGVLGILCTAVAMLLMFYLVNHAGASRATLITYINPAVASLLGVWLLDERLGAGGVAGFALILLGSWLATRGGTPKPAHSELAEER
jgi:drug/metabolite transporter (DMT)-like permease